MNQKLSNKGLWCSDTASCKAATPFEVGSLMVNEGVGGMRGWMDVGWKTGRRAVNERRGQ